MSSDKEAIAKRPRRRWFQFSLATMLLLMTLCGVWGAWTRAYLQTLEAQWDALAEIEPPPSENADFTGVLAYETEAANILGCALPDSVNSKWKEIRSLRLTNACVWRAAPVITRLPYLTKVEIVSGTITDGGLEMLGSLPRLRELKVSCKQVTGGFLASGRLRERLESLELASRVCNDSGLHRVGECTKLKRLVLLDSNGKSSWRWSDDRVTFLNSSYLSGLTELQELKILAYLPQEALPSIKRLPRLRKLDIASPLSDADVVAWQQSRPNLTITRW